MGGSGALSWADLIVLAGTTALEEAGGQELKVGLRNKGRLACGSEGKSLTGK